MPSILFINESPYDQAIGAIPPPAPLPITVLSQPPSPSVAVGQGQDVINREVHVHVTSGGVLTAESGDALVITVEAATPSGIEIVEVTGIVVDDQPHVDVDPALLAALQEALAAGTHVMLPDGTIVPVDFVDASTDLPPAVAPQDPGITLTDPPILPEAPLAEQPPEGCLTIPIPEFDSIGGIIGFRLYHESQPGVLTPI